MLVRVNGRLVSVWDRYKKPLDRLKRNWGTEAIYLTISDDEKAVNVNVVYTGSTHLRMRIKKL